jgi:membrane associated rhomboid family serine protease
MVFLPIGDDNPLRVIRVQYVTGALIALNVVIFLLTGGFRGEEFLAQMVTGYGVVPSELLDATRVPSPALNPVSEPVTLFTYMFMHAGWMHLIGNMAFLWVFADNVEDAFGHPAFLIFYLICGLAGAAAHIAFYPTSNVPLVGASGAVSGVLASYFILFPKARITVMAYVIPLRLPAWVVLGGWIALQFFSLFSTNPEAQAVAWWAHIGGFAAGLLMTLALRSRLRA